MAEKGHAINVFMSGQQNKTSFSHLPNFARLCVKASAPEINVRNAGDTGWPTVVKSEDSYNASVVPGVLITAAMMKLFSVPAVVKQMKRVFPEDATPKLTFQFLFQDKLREDKAKPNGGKLGKGLALLRENGENKTADAIESFRDKYLELDGSTIKTTEDWMNYMKNVCGFPDGWERNLHYNTVLTYCFGCDPEVSAKVRQTPVQDGNETSKIEHYSFRWIFKAMCSIDLNGCKTDVVNGVMAVLRWPTVKLDGSRHGEEDCAAALNTMTNLLANGSSYDDLWIPDVHMHDAEVDDRKLTAIFNTIRLCPCTQIVQLPSPKECPGEFSDLIGYFNKQNNNCCIVYPDPLSENAREIRRMVKDGLFKY